MLCFLFTDGHLIIYEVIIIDETILSLDFRLYKIKKNPNTLIMAYFFPRSINDGNGSWLKQEKTDCNCKLLRLACEHEFDAGLSMNIQYAGVSPMVIVAASVQAS